MKKTKIKFIRNHILQVVLTALSLVLYFYGYIEHETHYVVILLALFVTLFLNERVFREENRDEYERRIEELKCKIKDGNKQ